MTDFEMPHVDMTEEEREAMARADAIMHMADELGDVLSEEERFAQITVMSDKWQTMLEGMDVMVGAGAAMQIILHAMQMVAENNPDVLDVPESDLFVMYTNALAMNMVQTAEQNKKMPRGGHA